MLFAQAQTCVKNGRDEQALSGYLNARVFSAIEVLACSVVGSVVRSLLAHVRSHSTLDLTNRYGHWRSLRLGVPFGSLSAADQYPTVLRQRSPAFFEQVPRCSLALEVTIVRHNTRSESTPL